MTQVKSITIVGGGTAGLISALILQKRSNTDITLIYSSNVGIIGVGEGSTEHFNQFMNFVGIQPDDIVKECDATFKIGLLFDGWTKDSSSYLHAIIPGYDLSVGQYPAFYAREIANDSKYFYPTSILDNLIPKLNICDINNVPPTYQYHFDTFKLNEFLKKVARNNGITIIDDDILDITLDSYGNVDTLIGKNSTYKSDFYLDATGFKRLIMNKLNVKWISFNKYLTMNSAITFLTPDEPNYNYWSSAKAMDAGWLFKIPVWGRHGNGYVYDSNFITIDKAKLEVEKVVGHEVDVGRQFTFDAGMLENIWEKNCVAVGLSGCFFEPLEASSIGLTIQQTFLLMHKLNNYNSSVIQDYNVSMKNIIENIRDFIVLHYLGKRDDTEFWQSMLKLELPDSLSNNLEKWKTKLPIDEDFRKISSYSMFGSKNYTLIMAGLNLFDKQAIKEEYEFLSDEIKDDIKQLKNQLKNAENFHTYITHKEALQTIRDR